MQALRSSYPRPTASITLYGCAQHSQVKQLCTGRSNAVRFSPAVAAGQLPWHRQQTARSTGLQSAVLPPAHSPSLPQPAPGLPFGQTGRARTYARLPERGSTVPHSTVTNSSPGATWREKAAGGFTHSYVSFRVQPELVPDAADSLTWTCTSRQRPGVSAAGIHHRGGEHPGLGSRCSAAEQAAVLGHAQA